MNKFEVIVEALIGFFEKKLTVFESVIIFVT